MEEMQKLSRTDRLRHAGNAAQLAGIAGYESIEGAGRGQRVYRVTTGGGLVYTVLPDNALDIYEVSYRGVNVSYLSKVGLTRDFLAFEDEFKRTFSGGMLYTCGLLNAGPGNRDGETWHPLHGRAHGLRVDPLSAVASEEKLTLAGEIKEAELFSHNLTLRRSISSAVFGSEIRIDDVLSNLVPEPAEYMMLYHLNFGYPFLSEHLRLVLPEGTVTTPRTEFAREGLGDACRFTAPVDGREEQVYFHDIPAVDGIASLQLRNDQLGIGCEVSCRKDALPLVVEWKSMRSGEYALGIEPSNSYINGRAAERENGTIRTLAPFEQVPFQVALRFFVC